MRIKSKEAYNDAHLIRSHPIKVGDMVLLYDKKTDIDISTVLKLRYRWLGPYKIMEADPLKETYRVTELDNVILHSTITENRLKAFNQRYQYIGTNSEESTIEQEEINKSTKVDSTARTEDETSEERDLRERRAAIPEG